MVDTKMFVRLKITRQLVQLVFFKACIISNNISCSPPSSNLQPKRALNEWPLPGRSHLLFLAEGAPAAASERASDLLALRKFHFQLLPVSRLSAASRPTLYALLRPGYQEIMKYHFYAISVNIVRTKCYLSNGSSILIRLLVG